MAALQIQYGSRQMSLPIQGRMTIGRAGTNRIVVPDETVSPEHAVIGTSQGRMVLKVLAKDEGIILNGEAFRGSRLLQPSDWFQIGKARMVYLEEDLPWTVAASQCGSLSNGSIAPQATQPSETAATSTITNSKPPLTGLRCGICQCMLDEEFDTMFCPVCSLPYHTDCWQENRGCGAYGCTQVGALQSEPDIRILSTDVQEPIATSLPNAEQLISTEGPDRAEKEDLALQEIAGGLILIGVGLALMIFTTWKMAGALIVWGIWAVVKGLYLFVRS